MEITLGGVLRHVRPREKEWIEMTTSTRELLLNDALVLMEETEGNE